MLTVPAVRGALPYFDAVGLGAIAVAAARATGADAVDSKPDGTEGTESLRSGSDCNLRFAPERGHESLPSRRTNRLLPSCEWRLVEDIFD
jgi:hypothetical protein